MDHQTIINTLFGISGAAIGWVLKVVWDAIQSLKVDLGQLERRLPEVYVRKDDFRQAVTDMKEDFKDLKSDMKDGFSKLDSTLNILSKKLDSKSDKE
jgi:hypothetical protein